MGFPWLQGEDLKRVTSANDIYIQFAKFCRWPHSFNIGFSIENPTHSLLWCIQQYVDMLDIAFFVDFDACMHGSEHGIETYIIPDEC